MLPESKRHLRLIEDAVEDVLRPLRFAKHKLNWRRPTNELLQQFSIVSMQLSDQYRPEWGVNILARQPSRTPLVWQMHAQWMFEMCVADLKERLEYFRCLELRVSMPDERRVELITRLLRKHVLPRFEAFTTEESVRRMMGDRKYPLRAQSYWKLPDSWWPPDQQNMSEYEGDPPPVIIRPWNPKINRIG